jgi:hypothetical protein
MKRLVFTAATVGGAAFALHHLDPRLRAMCAHCQGITVTGGATPI